MNRIGIIVFAGVCVLFVTSWFLKGSVGDATMTEGFLITLSAFLTLAIMSFLYKDNPYYKFAEHLFVGVSAAFWMTMGFWSTIVGNLIPRISDSLGAWFLQPKGEINYFFLLPIFFGFLLLMRLAPKGGWLSRWPLAFIIGTTAGLNFVRYLRSDFINQISATFVPLVVDWQGFGHFFGNLSLSATGPLVAMVGNFVIFGGVICGLIYFFFSKEHTGWFGTASRIGIWVLMVTFGASFGYTVMGRISLLVGRLTFLLRDWLELMT